MDIPDQRLCPQTLSLQSLLQGSTICESSVRFLAGRKARREQIEELPVSFDRRGDRVDKAARAGSED
jgi:hypothetical protein